VFKEHPEIDSVIHFAALKVSYTAIPSRIISD
jgi:hypothetical protein